MSLKEERGKGVFALIILSLVTASMGLFARALSVQFTILQQVYLRITVAFFLGLLIFHDDLHLQKLKKISGKEWLLLFTRSTLSYLLGVTIFSQAVNLTKISNTSFISAMPFAAIFGFFFFNEKLTTKKLCYILLGFIGVLLVAVKDYSHLFNWGSGEVLALVSSFCLALSKISRKWQSDLLNNKEMAVIMFFISSVLIAATSVFLNEHLIAPQHWPLHIYFVLLGAGLFNVAFLFLVNYGFEKIEASLTNNLWC